MADTQSQFIKYTHSYPDSLLVWEMRLPLPPSVNQMYSYGKSGPYLNNEVKTYRLQVQQLVSKVPHVPYGDRLAMDVYVTAKGNQRRDMDNVQKVLLDSLTKAGVYADDSQIDDIRVRRAMIQKDNAHVLVRLYRLNDVVQKDWDRMEAEGFYQLNGKPRCLAPKATKPIKPKL